MKSQESSPNNPKHRKPFLPVLSYIQKDKKYYYNSSDHQNSLKCDLDSIIFSLGQG